jgi:RNA recognition motif-containing protein
VKISVNNLSADATEDDLRTLFELFGKVNFVEVQASRGRGMVDMSSNSAAREAISGLNGETLLGFELDVTEVQERRGPPRGRKPRRRKRR